MSEAGTVAKIVIVLGVVFILIGLMYPGNDTGWTTFEETTRNFPTFSNPFDTNVIEAPIALIADGVSTPATVVDVVGLDDCTPPNTDWWGCMTTRDAEGSYATSLITTNEDIEMRLSNVLGAPAGLPILSVKAAIQCRGTGATVAFDLAFETAGSVLLWQIPSGTAKCDKDAWTNVSFSASFDYPHDTVGELNGGYVSFNPSSPYNAAWSYLSVIVVYGTTAECASADTLAYIGCILSGVFDTFVKVWAFIIGGIIFLGAVAVYILTIAVSFLGVLTFLFAVPNAPPYVQAFLTAFLIGAIVIVVFSVLRIARGSGGVG